MATRTILLDVGGTFIKCSDGRSIPINSDGTRDDITSVLRDAMAGYSSAAVAIPGPFDYDHGVFMMKHKFSAVYGECFADLCGRPKAEIRYIHDVNCMLLGEMTQGNGREYRRVALVTLGTGLGFSMSINDAILKSETGSPLISIYNIPFRDGILEDYVSKRGIMRAYGSEQVSVRQIAEMALAGDVRAHKAFEDTANIIASAIIPLLDNYAIEALLFGGQISRSFSLMEPALSKRLQIVPSLRFLGPVSDIDNATFNGLRTLAGL